MSVSQDVLVTDGPGAILGYNTPTHLMSVSQDVLVSDGPGAILGYNTPTHLMSGYPGM